MYEGAGLNRLLNRRDPVFDFRNNTGDASVKRCSGCVNAARTRQVTNCHHRSCGEIFSATSAAPVSVRWSLSNSSGTPGAA